MNYKKIKTLNHLIGYLFLFVLSFNSASAQQETQKSIPLFIGTVMDNNGKVIPNVSIKNSEGKTLTTTDSMGNFKIRNLNWNSKLELNHVGYEIKTIDVNGQNNLNINLKSLSNDLNEVIVIGYGTQKKADLTGAISSMKGDALDERPIARVDQALVGQMSGVQVKQTTGSPGKAFSINIRGTGSLTAGNEPLYVIDGFPMVTNGTNSAGGFSSGSPLDNINPNDIENIEVLKDAAAAAIYGSRAANGVVLITTKQGKAGKTQILFNAYGGISKAGKKLNLLNGQEWINRAKEMIDENWVASAAGRTASQTYAERLGILGGLNVSYMQDPRWDSSGLPGLEQVDWQDASFRNGPFQNYQLSASGGTEKVKYYISGNYKDQQGFVIGQGYKNYAARANVDVRPSSVFQYGLNIAPSYAITEDPGVEGKDNILQQILQMAPIQEDTMGLYPSSFNNDQYLWGGSKNSPVALLKNKIGETKNFRTIMSSYIQYRPIKELLLKSTVNFDNVDMNSTVYTPYTVTGTLISRQTKPNVNTTGTYSTFSRQNFVNENTLNFNKSIGAHNFNLLGGQSYSWYYSSASSLSSNGGYSSSSITTINGSASAATGTQTATRNTLLSFFSRLQYDYNGKYLLSASIRTDGSSRFGSNNKWGVFPSLSLGWRVSKEAFFQENVQFINDLKLRASYGKNGNNNIGDYNAYSLLAASNYTFNNTQASGIAYSSQGDPNLKWEMSETYDYGIDVSMFNSRISASFDYYRKTTKDLLLNQPVPSDIGVSTILTNAGSVRNWGWELTLNTKNIVGAFSWNTSINLSNNQNKVLSLGSGQTSFDITQSFGSYSYATMAVGLPMYSLKVVKQDGVLTQAEIDNGAAMFNTEKAGDPRYIDQNGDGKITDADRVIVGHPNPNYIWGITNNFRYKNFDLSFLIQGQNGGSIYSLLGRAINLTGMAYTQNILNVDVATRGNYRTTFGAISNTDWLYSSNYVSVRNITLGYNLPQTALTKMGFIHNVRLYCSLENYFYWDKYKGGYNPQAENTNLSGDSNFPMPGDYGGLPIAKSMVFGLNVAF